MKTGKIGVIILLMLAIALLAFLQWKKDLIMRKVMEEVQTQMVDSLRYSDVTLNWFSSFPSVTIELQGLHVGSGKYPLVQGGDVEIILKLVPLFRDKLIINRLRVSGSHLNIIQQNGKWSYDVFRTKEDQPRDAITTLVRRIDIDDTRLFYNDGESVAMTFYVQSGSMEGGLTGQKLDADISCIGAVEQLKLPSYALPVTVDFSLDGQYIYDRTTGLHEFKTWEVSNNAITFSVNGSLLHEGHNTDVDLEINWKDGQPEQMKPWLPKEIFESWKAYILSGKTEGYASIQGKSTSATSPRILAQAKWKNGGVDFLTSEEDLEGLDVEVKYDSGDPKTKQPSCLSLSLKKGGMLGRSMEGNLRIQNLQKPVVNASLKGQFPARLLNLLAIKGLLVERGQFDIQQLDVIDLSVSGVGLLSFITSTEASLEIDDVSLTLFGNPTSVADGNIRIATNTLQLEAADLAWSNAKAKDVKGIFDVKDEHLDYSVTGKMCEGELDVKGNLTGLTTTPVMQSRWIVKSMEMQDLMASFSNFDQRFITSDHISGKANIWAESTIPFNDRWEIKTREVLVRSAIDIHDGRLKDMKTLEDFATYVHLEDLQDIRFNQLRNYLKIEAGKVYLPVMFMQSSAINLSISGVHGFDQKILYNVKVNAGQTAASKLKKSDVRKELKQARKSGWINLYFILEGSTSDVRYQQYRTAVISGFEQSARLKEDLRKYLVDTFGYDIYWIEPNEWEDIPEYK